jgi:hypothetical protein
MLALTITIEGPSDDTIDLEFGWCVSGAPGIEPESMVVFSAPSVVESSSNSIFDFIFQKSQMAIAAVQPA